jgi:signal transduction histidine kinase
LLARLVTILTFLMMCVLLALGFPLARSVGGQAQDTLFSDRLDDTQYAAALAGDSPPDDSPSALSTQMVRYHDLYGITIAEVGRDGRSSSAGGEIRAEGPVLGPLRDAWSGRHSSNPAMIMPWQNDPMIVAVPVVRSGDVVGAMVTVSPTDRLRTGVAWIWALIGLGELLALGLCLLLAHRMASWVLRPVRALDAVTHTIAVGRLDARVSATAGPPELRRLATSFNEMADHMEQAMHRQEQFASDASHQMRNPLSAMLLRLESVRLVVPPDSDEELTGEITAVHEEGKRLTRVLDELLELARAGGREAEPEDVDLVPLADDRVKAWRPRAADRRIALERTGIGVARAYTDPTALGSALDALIDNALKYSPKGGAVDVYVGDADGSLVIQVTDQGPGLAPEEYSRIGDRFWRSPRHQNVAGSGLGLAVARTLIQAAGGTLTLSPAPDHGLRAAISVPRLRE